MQLVPAVPDQHQPFPRAHCHQRPFPVLRSGISSSAEQISPHRTQGWTIRSFPPGKTETTEKLESPTSWEKP